MGRYGSTNGTFKRAGMGVERPSGSSEPGSAEPTTVYALLRPFLIPFKTLKKKHLSLLLAVRKIVGVTPNCASSQHTLYHAVI